jgi:hypothetical protein
MMKTDLREFNENGIRVFRDYLNQIKNNDIDQDFTGIITDDQYTNIIKSGVEIDTSLPRSKIDAGKYLHSIVSTLNIDNKYYRPGLWTWLSAFYFDSICPAKDNGSRFVGEEARYILIPGRHIYRHLLAGPVQIFDSYGDTSHVLLFGDISVMGDYVEQFAGRINITSSKGIIEAIDLLYWDYGKNQPISGATSRKKPGNIRRFTDIIGQFILTYDLTSMGGPEILQLLPKEFDKYKNNITLLLE